MIEAKIFPPQEILDTLDTGDIVLTANSKLSSMIVMHSSGGQYSHLGFVYRNHQGLWLVESTNYGVLVEDLKSFFNSPKKKIFRIKILKLKDQKREMLKSVVKQLLMYRDQIEFDLDLHLDEKIPSIDELKTEKFKYYCTEMVFKIFQMSYGADYIQWADCKEKARANIQKFQAGYEQVSKFYFTLNAQRMLHFRDVILNMDQTPLLAPDGILISDKFDIIYDQEDLQLVYPELKIFLTEDLSKEPV